MSTARAPIPLLLTPALLLGTLLGALPRTSREVRAVGAPAAGAASSLEQFEREVRPLLVERCVGCHGEKRRKGGLRLDEPALIALGGDSGAAIVARDLETSRLIRAVRYQDDELRMPPKGRLDDDEIAVLERWVASGAALPESAASGEPRSATQRDFERERQAHWAFRALEPPDGERDLSREIDRLVDAKLTAAGLQAAPRADPRTLLFRAHLVLTGLPPTRAELDRFLADDSEEAWAKVVDRLLASPRFGERWGRHWLDVARYADSNGSDENTNHGEAWRYRDWVVRSLSMDLPYPEFVRLQLAGDLQPASRAREDVLDGLVATGFLLLGPKVLAEPDKLKMELDIVDESIDVTSKAFLGITISCARCHDHKFDAVSARDYHALVGVFRSTRFMERYATVARWLERPLATGEELAEIDRLEGDARQARLDALPRAMAVRDADRAIDQPVLVRGEPHNAVGEPVPRGAPGLLGDRVPVNPVSAGESGRKELAEWIVDTRNPLTARVAVNRIWYGHFGRGLVASPNDLGVRGELPSHPGLLDRLARELVDGGGSQKRLHRAILLGETFRRGQLASEVAVERDPDGALLSTYRSRRLEAEGVRDTLLFRGGLLDLAIGGSLRSQKSWDYVRGEHHGDSTRRAIYLPVIRNSLNDLFVAFDHNSTEVSVGARPSTTVPQQALFLLNNELVKKVAASVARRALEGAGSFDERVTLAYDLVLAREPSANEVRRIEEYLAKIAPIDSDEDATRALTDIVTTLLISSECLSIP